MVRFAKLSGGSVSHLLLVVQAWLTGVGWVVNIFVPCRGWGSCVYSVLQFVLHNEFHSAAFDVTTCQSNLAK